MAVEEAMQIDSAPATANGHEADFDVESCEYTYLKHHIITTAVKLT